MEEKAKQLKKPFKVDEIEWRIQSKDKNNEWAIVLAYVTNRAIMDRLDEVFGIEGWSNEFTTAPDGGILCGITAYMNEMPITKYDGAENTKVDPIKGGLSNAMKRSAVQWGIGRYLYELDTSFVKPTQLKPPAMKGYSSYYDQDTRKRYYWKHPELPEFARPSSTG